jgi:septal ring factor EnvC (AmiA/AmiB activator)
MFLNIFQSISIDEIQKLFEDSEANKVRTKIEYIFFVEEIKNFRKLSCLKHVLSGIEKVSKSIGKIGENLFPEKPENQKEKSKEKNLDSHNMKKVNSRINHIKSKTGSIEKKVEQNFEEINNKIEKLENMMKEIHNLIKNKN